jgi:hypothetical protein
MSSTSKLASGRTSRLGRNPLEKLQTQTIHSEFALPPAETRPVTAIEKIKEMQIQVDWPEFYEGTVGFALKNISKYLKR